MSRSPSWSSFASRCGIWWQTGHFTSPQLCFLTLQCQTSPLPSLLPSSSSVRHVGLTLRFQEESSKITALFLHTQRLFPHKCVIISLFGWINSITNVTAMLSLISRGWKAAICALQQPQRCGFSYSREETPRGLSEMCFCTCCYSYLSPILHKLPHGYLEHIRCGIPAQTQGGLQIQPGNCCWFGSCPGKDSWKLQPPHSVKTRDIILKNNRHWWWV